LSILITGSSGFIGKNYFDHSENKSKSVSVSLQKKAIGQIDFSQTKTIVHLAGIAHRMNEPSGKIYYDVNTDLTFALAKHAKSKGVSQFIFVSTIKVFGEKKGFDITFNAQSPCEPHDDYGKSKYKAEQALAELQDKNFKIAIIRPSLVYGKGVKGNLEKLMGLITKGYKLPFGDIDNKRSMIYVGNLIAMIDTIIDQQAHGIFIGTDQRPMSTSQLIQNIQTNLGQQNKLFSLPKSFRILIKLLKPELYKRLFCSLVVENTKAYDNLNFIPPYSTSEGIEDMVNHYKENN